MSVAGPVTKSPAAKTPRTFVAYVAGSTLRRPRATSKAASTGRKLRSAAWDTAGMTVSAGTTNSEPGIGTGERRPEASGSPSLFRMKRTPVSLPSSPTSSIGLTRNSIRTPSRSVSPSSSSSTTSSERVRR